MSLNLKTLVARLVARAFVISFTALSSSCALAVAKGEMIWLSREGANMPIWLRGDFGSDTVILKVHGGPGGSSIREIYGGKDCAVMEKHCLMAYWDQRGSGASRGNPPDSSFTLESFVQDMDLAVDVLRLRFPEKRIVVQGHSWGGRLSAAYLIAPERQAKVSGWIFCDGSVSTEMEDRLCVEWLVSEARRRIDAGMDAAYWTEALAWLAEHPEPFDYSDPELKDFKRVSEYLYAADAYCRDPKLNAETDGGTASYYPELTMASPLDLFAWLDGLYRVKLRMGTAPEETDLLPSLGAITVPTLIAWGEHDGRIPVAMADTVYAALGTPAESKRVVVFGESAHCPSDEEPEAFCRECLAFIDGLGM